MLRKWVYVAKTLRHLKAPSNVINAAQEIDNILVNLGLDHNTPRWMDYISKHEYINEDWSSVRYLMGEPDFCSACFDVNNIDINCSNCLLSKGNASCTPRSVYANDYCKIISDYINYRC